MAGVRRDNFEVHPAQTMALFCCVSVLCTTPTAPAPLCHQGSQIPGRNPVQGAGPSPGVGGRAVSPRVVLVARMGKPGGSSSAMTSSGILLGFNPLCQERGWNRDLSFGTFRATRGHTWQPEGQFSCAGGATGPQEEKSLCVLGSAGRSASGARGQLCC